MIQGLEASSQLEGRDLENYALYTLLGHCLDFIPLRLHRHICYDIVCPAYLVLALLIKCKLFVKRIFPYCHKL